MENQINYKFSNKIHGLFIINPFVFRDKRGSNCETYHVDKFLSILSKFSEFNFPTTFSVDSHSVSRKSVIRGMHADNFNFKLISCIYGEVFFVVIDIRRKSPTVDNIEYFNLIGNDFTQILIPKGCAIGYQCLSNRCGFNYKFSYSYTPINQQIQIKYNDPKYNISWPLSNPILSDRDK